MSHHIMSRGLHVAASSMLLVALASTPVLASDRTSELGSHESFATGSPTPRVTITPRLARTDDAREVETETESPRPSRSPRPSINPSAEHSGRLDDKGQKVCAQHHGKALGIMNRINGRATTQAATFGTIATRVEAFYVAGGHTLSNYDALVAAVNAAKANVDTDLANLKTMTRVDCTGTDPKGDISAFKAAAAQLQTDLKAYRVAIKNLIAGVLSVNPRPSVSPTPSPTTSASPAGVNQ